MALFDLSTGAMIQTLEYILVQKAPRSILEGNSLLTALLPRLESSFEDLKNSRTSKIDTNAVQELNELRAELGQLDSRHDELNRSNFGLLTLAADLYEDEAKKTHTLAIREAMYPLSLKVNVMSYIDEAGESVRLGRQLESDGALRNALAGLSIHLDGTSTNALSLSQEIVATGKKMQALLLRINELETGGTSPETQARRMFIRWISRLDDLARLELEEQPEQYRLLFKELQHHLDAVPTRPTAPTTTPDPSPVPSPSPL